MDRRNTIGFWSLRENGSKELSEKNEPSERVRRYPEIQKHVIEWGYLIGILRCGELAPAQAPILLWGYEPRRGLEESETNKPPAMRVRIEG